MRHPISSAARAAIDDAAADASRALRYAAGAVAISFVGNVVHLVGEVASVADLATAHGAAVAAEALGGPSLVFICSHLLMHADRGRRIERLPLWAGFVAGAALSAVHLWSVAFAVLSVGLLAEIHELAPYLASGLLPVGVEGAAIGSIQQAARFRSERDRLAADTLAVEAERAEAERRARQEADAEARRLAEIQRAEADRLAAEAEAARQQAEIEAARQATAEAELATAEAEEARARQDRLKAHQAVVNGAGNGKGSKATGKRDTGQAIADYLAENPDATKPEVAKAVGISPRSVGRYGAWKDHQTARAAIPAPGPADPEAQPADVDDQEIGETARLEVVAS